MLNQFERRVDCEWNPGQVHIGYVQGTSAHMVAELGNRIVLNRHPELTLHAAAVLGYDAVRLLEVDARNTLDIHAEVVRVDMLGRPQITRRR